MAKTKKTVIVCIAILMAIVILCLFINVNFKEKEEYEDFEVNITGSIDDFCMEDCVEHYVTLGIGPESYLDQCYIKKIEFDKEIVTCRCGVWKRGTVLNTIKGMFIKQ